MKCCNNKRNGRSCVSTSATFASSFSDSGVHKLDPNLTINNIIVQPTFLYYGGDATASSWMPRIGDSAGTFGAPTGTGHTYNAGSPLLGSNDDSIKFSGNGLYRLGVSETSFGDVSTEDLVFEAIYEISAGAGLTIMAKGVAGGPAGWRINSNLSFGIVLHDGATQATGGIGALVVGAWYHCMCFVDKSGSAQPYVNAVAGSPFAVSALGSLTNGYRFAIGGNSDESVKYDRRIAYVAMWQRDNWLDTHLQATVAQERFNKLSGIYPQIAKGTPTPTVQTRATPAYLDKVEADGTGKLYQVGAGWLRCCSRNDANGVNVKGYLSEPAATNLVLQSETFATTWTTTNCSIPTTSVAVPNGLSLTTVTIHEDGTAAASHGIEQGSITLAATTKYVVSVWAKAVYRNWFKLAAGIVNASAFFNLSTGAIGTTANGASGIEDWGNGWYRCWVSFTTTTSVPYAFYLIVAEANGDQTFDGANEDSIYVFGCQVEIGDYPSSYIPTTTAAATRTADALRYKGDDGNLGGVGSNQKGTLVCDVLLPNVDVSSDNYIYSLSDGGSASDAIILKTDSSDVPVLIGASTADGTHVSGSGNTDLWSNIKYNLKTTWQTNDYALFVSGSSSITDTSVPNPPDDIDRIDVGASVSSAQQTSGLIANLKIYGKPT